MAIYEYAQDMRRRGWYDKQDVIEKKVTEAIPEYALVSRVDADNSIANYDPNVSVSTEIPLGVCVNKDVASGGVGNFAIRGTFGDNSVFITSVVDSFNGDADGGTGGVAKTVFTLNRSCLEIIKVETADADTDPSTYTEMDSSRYEVEDKTFTILNVAHAPAEGSTNTAQLKITYKAKPNDTDIKNFEQAVIINKVTEVSL